MGCKIEPPGSWPTAPQNAYILGLKELPKEPFQINHKHIYFAHAYKKQAGATALLKRFKDGRGIIYDLEYLCDNNKRRVVTFGRWAGFAGAAIGLDIFCHQRNSALVQQTDPDKGYPAITQSFDLAGLVDLLTKKLSLVKTKPKIIVIGAEGRTGQGAMELLRMLNLPATRWDLQETRGGGPFREIVDHNVLINCVFVQKRISPFLTFETLEHPGRCLSVIADVSCEAGNPNNPLPVYDGVTTFKRPVRRIVSGELPLDVMAIDHLPSLLPKESSIDFSRQLLPHLISLLKSEKIPRIWRDTKAYYDQNC